MKNFVKDSLKGTWLYLPKVVRMFFIVVFLIALIVFFIYFANLTMNIRGMIEDVIKQEEVEELRPFRSGDLESDKEETEIIKDPSEGYSPEEEVVIEDKEQEEQFIKSSFYDTFSGTSWISKTDTSAYHNSMVTGYSFPPDFNWQVINKTNETFERSVTALIKDKAKDISGNSFVNKTFGYVGNDVYMGTVRLENERYKGELWKYEDGSFKKITDGPVFNSKYEGLIGFGGELDDFLVVYGAYEGQAVRVRGDEIEDISEFFGIRVMNNNGFWPYVIKSGDNWYVYSSTKRIPKLLKLFEDSDGNIAGALDLSQKIVSKGMERVLFTKTGEHTLLAKIENISGVTQYKEFEDLGFKKDMPIRIVSSNINSNSGAVKKAKIQLQGFSGDGAEIKLYLSNDGNNWHRVEDGEMFEFKETGRGLFWKMEAYPQGSKYVSPFLERVRLEYYWNMIDS